MKILLFLLSMEIFSSCGASDNPISKEVVIQQENIIELVLKNKMEAVKKALENAANVNTQDKSKRNLLLLATINKQVAMAKLLVEKWG